MRGPVKLINRPNDLKKGYILRLETGIILSLLICISALKVDIRSSDKGELIVTTQQEEVYMEEIVQTKQELKAPPPPRPVVPIEVPNDEVIEDEIIQLDSELDLDQDFLEMPAPPPKYEEDPEEEIFIVVEQMPELVGGLAAIQKMINYPEIARRAGIEGRVVVQFIIDEEGNVLDPKVVRSIGGGCDEEAIRAVKMAKFIPGKQRGRPVKVSFNLPITFKLKSDKEL